MYFYLQNFETKYFLDSWRCIDISHWDCGAIITGFDFRRWLLMWNSLSIKSEAFQVYNCTYIWNCNFHLLTLNQTGLFCVTNFINWISIVIPNSKLLLLLLKFHLHFTYFLTLITFTEKTEINIDFQNRKLWTII